MVEHDSDEFNDEPYDDDLYQDDADSEPQQCPECNAEAHSLADVCSQCGHFFIDEPVSVWANRPGWWIALGLLGIIAVIWMLVGL